MNLLDRKHTKTVLLWVLGGLVVCLGISAGVHWVIQSKYGSAYDQINWEYEANHRPKSALEDFSDSEFSSDSSASTPTVSKYTCSYDSTSELFAIQASGARFIARSKNPASDGSDFLGAHLPDGTLIWREDEPSGEGTYDLDTIRVKKTGDTRSTVLYRAGPQNFTDLNNRKHVGVIDDVTDIRYSQDDGAVYIETAIEHFRYKILRYSMSTGKVDLVYSGNQGANSGCVYYGTTSAGAVLLHCSMGDAGNSSDYVDIVRSTKDRETVSSRFLSLGELTGDQIYIDHPLATQVGFARSINSLVFVTPDPANSQSALLHLKNVDTKEVTVHPLAVGLAASFWEIEWDKPTHYVLSPGGRYLALWNSQTKIVYVVQVSNGALVATGPLPEPPLGFLQAPSRDGFGKQRLTDLFYATTYTYGASPAEFVLNSAQLTADGTFDLAPIPEGDFCFSFDRNIIYDENGLLYMRAKKRESPQTAMLSSLPTTSAAGL